MTDTASPREASFPFPFDTKPPTSGAGANLNAVAATDTGWIAVGFVSPRPFAATAAEDGLVWHPIFVPGDGYLWDVAFGNGIAVAVVPPAISPIITQILTLLPNGTWQRTIPFNIFASNVVFGNGKFVVYGQTNGVSSNGIDWTESIGTNWTRFVDGQFVAYENRNPYGVLSFRTSSEGLTWSDPEVATAPIAHMGFLDVIGGNLAGMAEPPLCDSGACGSRELIWLSGNRGTAPSKLTGISVTLPLPSDNADSGYGAASAGPPKAVASNGTRMVAISEHGAIWSAPIPAVPPPPEGPAWTVASIPENWVMKDVSYAFGKFVAVGRVEIDSEAIIVVSEDGLLWQNAEIRNP